MSMSFSCINDLEIGDLMKVMDEYVLFPLT